MNIYIYFQMQSWYKIVESLIQREIIVFFCLLIHNLGSMSVEGNEIVQLTGEQKDTNLNPY